MDHATARQGRLLDTIGFQTYGLGPEWQGPRTLGSLTVYEEKVQIVGLVHGSPRAGIGSQIRVESYADGMLDPPEKRAAEALARLRTLVQLYAKSAPAAAGDPSPREVRIGVESRVVTFSALADGPLWAATARDPDVTVTILAVDADLDDVRLVLVDPHEYLAGLRAL